MSLLGTLERAAQRRSTIEIARDSLFAFLCPALHEVTERHCVRRRRRDVDVVQRSKLGSDADMENVFIAGLVRAGSCRGDRQAAESPIRQLRSGARIEAYQMQRRSIHTRPTQPNQGAIAPHAVHSREDLHDLVDIYETRERPEWTTSSMNEPVDSVGIGPEVLDDTQWDESYFTGNHVVDMNTAPAYSETAQTVDTMQRLLLDAEVPHSHLYALYKRLPDHRVNYLPPSVLFDLVKRLSSVPRSRFQPSYGNDYLSLLNDMRAENVHVNHTLWSTAIRYIGMAEGPREAVRLWRELEQSHDLRGNNYTFSILFDLACKTQHYALAEMIEKEARDRQIPLDRVSRMSRIFYYGILGDGASVRKAYASLVDAGEIVDTAVLTNVITALIDAGELPAAEETFARMKTLHASKKGATIAPQDWRQRRELRALLTDAAHRYRARPEDRQRFQDAAPINPDWRTYRAFIAHHARETGSWSSIESLLLEMRRSSIPLTREIYRILFLGFAKHGGIMMVAWNKRNLQLVWRDFEKSWRKRPGQFEYDPNLCVAVVRAFKHCVGRREAREVWEVILERWDVGGDVVRKVGLLLGSEREREGDYGSLGGDEKCS